MIRPLVSIVLPTYNRERYLGEAIQSALGQTWKSVELIVVDDGSQDNTPALIQSFADRDARVMAIRQLNGGVSAARNRALQAARGEYIAFLDSDDVWQPWKLELQIQLLQQQSQIGMVWTDMDAILPTGEIREHKHLKSYYSAYSKLAGGSPFNSFSPLSTLCREVGKEAGEIPVGVGSIYTEMLQGNLVHTPTVVLRKSWADHVGPFDTSMRRGGEDYKFHLATCRLGQVAFLDTSSILYRTGIGDHISNRENNLHFAQSFLKTVLGEVQQHRPLLRMTDTQIDQVLANAHDWLATESYANGLRWQACCHAWEAIRLRRAVHGSWRTILKAALPPKLVPWLRQFKASTGTHPRMERTSAP